MEDSFSTPPTFLFDANVMIDYKSAGLDVLKLIRDSIGKINIASPVLDEVKGLTPEICESIGLEIVEPRVKHVMQAVNAPAALSFEDYLCLILCREYEWICVTNDQNLRDACMESGVVTKRGLRLIAKVVWQVSSSREGFRTYDRMKIKIYVYPQLLGVEVWGTYLLHGSCGRHGIKHKIGIGWGKCTIPSNIFRGNRILGHT